MRARLRQAVLEELGQTLSGGGESGGRFLKIRKTAWLSCRIAVCYFRDPGGRVCAAYHAYACNPSEYVFHTQTCRGLFSALSAAFTVLTVCLACAVLRLLQKETRLERARGAFLTAAAHELKTPLAVIANNCECIAENVSPEKNAAYAAAAFAETRRTAEMLGQLLRLTALETAEAPARKSADLAALVREAAGKYREEAAQKALKLALEAPDALPLRCEATWTRAAFQNLISNAVRHTGAGGDVRIVLRRERRRAVLTVENAPAHIEEADLPHIWEPLYRGEKTSRAENGATGMGLSVCKRIFDLHGWTYQAENTANGVLFTVVMK